MARFAKPLPVRLPPEQFAVAAMRNDVIENAGGRDATRSTDRVTNQERPAQFLELAIIRLQMPVPDRVIFGVRAVVHVLVAIAARTGVTRTTRFAALVMCARRHKVRYQNDRG